MASPASRTTDPPGQQGQASLLLLGVVAVLLAGVVVLFAFGQALGARGKHQRAADLAAVSAAHVMRHHYGRLFEPAALPNGAPNPASPLAGRLPRARPRSRPDGRRSERRPLSTCPHRLSRRGLRAHQDHRLGSWKHRRARRG
jgi:hypothetical protein